MVRAWWREDPGPFKYYLNGIKGSLFLKNFKNGNKKTEGILIDGQKSGTWSGWFANGNRKYTGSYRKDKKDGKWIEWKNNGNEKINGQAVNVVLDYAKAIATFTYYNNTRGWIEERHGLL